MMLQKFFSKTTLPHSIRTYFGTTWELWKREINHTLWDWGVDGPFCSDPRCAQRLVPTKNENIWKCIRCGLARPLPSRDLASIRDNVIKFFEEEARENNELTVSW